MRLLTPATPPARGEQEDAAHTATRQPVNARL
jgi:hypothetical protein